MPFISKPEQYVLNRRNARHTKAGSQPLYLVRLHHSTYGG